VTRRSVGRKQIVWGAALSALLAVAGHEVWAHEQRNLAGQTAQSPPQQTTPPAAPTGRQGPSGGRFGGPGQGRCGDSLMNAGWEWWKDDRATKEMGLKPEQISRLDAFYTRRMKDIDPVVQESQRESAVLDKMFADRTVDEATLSTEIAKASALRALIAQSRIIMLYRMAKVLDTDQYTKLKAIHDRHVQEACGNRGGGPRPGSVPLPY